MRLKFVTLIFLVLVIGAGIYSSRSFDFLGKDQGMTVAISNSSEKRSSVLLDVPFTSQTLLGNWNDLRQQEGCEEASVLMSIQWAKGEILSPIKAEKEIIAISEYQLKNYGYFQDTSVEDTVDRIFKGYFKYENVSVKQDIGLNDIKSELLKGNLVIAPVNGQKLNANYIRHMLVIIGHDQETREFIVNDPGLINGARLHLAENVMLNAIRDYVSGYYEPVKEERKNIIIVSRS